MIQLFLKNKIAVGLTAVVLAGTVGMTVGGMTLSQKMKTRFPADGYVLDVTVDDSQRASAQLMSFVSGEELRSAADGSLVFKDQDGAEIRTHEDSFIHYSDESITSVNGMLLTDLDEFSQGLMDSYYLDQLMALAKADTAYTIANNNTELQFENFLLKAGDDHYLLASPELTIDMKNGDSIRVDTGYLELRYLDDDGLVANLTDGNDAWQFLTDGCHVEYDNGAVLDLAMMVMGNGVADETTGQFTKMFALGNLNMDLASNITISQTPENTWQPPTFIVNPVDGENGQDGTSGEAGQAGAEGETGSSGKAGSAGQAGQAGQIGQSGISGANGVTGLAGKDGEHSEENTDNDDITLAPCVNVTSWDQTAGSVDFKICAYNTSLIQDGTSEAYVLNTKTGQVIYTWSNLELKTSQDGEEIPMKLEGLEANTTYKLVISARIMTSLDAVGNTEYAKSVLLSRVFSTDENGFYLKKVQAAYITDEEIPDWEATDDRAKTGAMLGFQATISGNQEIKEIRNVEMSYIDKDNGNRIVVDSRDNPLSQESECERLKETASGESTYYLFGLESNTSYTITMEVELTNGLTSTMTETYQTLKATPQVTRAIFDVNENRFFISTAQYVDDPDHAITQYDHEVYRYFDGDGLQTDDCLKKKTSPNAEVYIYLNDDIHVGKDDDGRDYYYGNIIYVTYYDNEKYVTKEVERDSAWSAQHISQSDSACILFKENDPDGGITADSINGTLMLYTGAGNTIYAGDNDFHRILVQVTASGYSNVLYYTDLGKWEDKDGDPLEGTSASGWLQTKFKLDGLSAETSYVVTVTAYFDQEGTNSTTVGSTVIKTTESR